MPGDSATFKETTDLLTSVTARVGYAWNNWLLYGKGGAAWASDRYSAFDALATYDFEGLETRFGWTAGAGVEWAFSDIWSVKLEYDYYGFGTRSVTFIDNVSGTVGPLGHQAEHSGRQSSVSIFILFPGSGRHAARVVRNDEL